MGRIHRRVVLAGATSTLVAGASAEAKVKVRFPRVIGLPGRGSYGPDVLRPEQLEQCLRAEKDINQGADALVESEAALGRQSAEIDGLENELNRSNILLDRSSQVAVDSYNAKVRRYNALVQEQREQVSSFNQRVRTHNANIDQFNSACANKKYYESDMKDVREKLGS